MSTININTLANLQGTIKIDVADIAVKQSLEALVSKDLLKETEGAGLVGFDSSLAYAAGTTGSSLKEIIADILKFGSDIGASLIGNGVQVVNSISAVRLLKKTSPSKFAIATAHTAAYQGVGGGLYRLDITDTTSADDNGTVVVATDGGRWKLMFDGVVTPEIFGAAGDGLVDDTAALNRMLATTYSSCRLVRSYRITDPLQDGSPALVSVAPRRKISGPGYITATSTVLRALLVSGEHSEVSVNINGNANIACGVRVTGPRSTVEHCDIFNLYTTTFSSIGIECQHNEGGFVVRNNRIRGLNSVGNGTTGDGNGMSRAVLMSFSSDVLERSYVHDNHCVDIMGEEGDALTVVATNGSGTYYDGKVTFSKNFVKNFTRRGVKSQSYGTRVFDNEFTHSLALAQVPNAQTVIDFVQGGDAMAKGNTLNGCKYFTQISVFAATGEAYNNFNISSNEIIGIGAETTKTIISVSPKGDNVKIKGNTIFGGTGRLISAGECTNLIISDNDLWATDNAAQRTISIASTSPGAIVRSNTLFTGLRDSLVASDALDVLVKDNHAKTNTVLFKQNSGNANNLVLNNTANGTQPIAAGGSTATGNRFADNYTMGQQSNTAPGLLYCTTAGGPSVQFAGLYIPLGQHVLDSTPTAAANSGWVALSAGLAETVNWKTEGNISA